MAGDRIADSAEVLVHHYEQALLLARAAGEDLLDLEGQVRRFLLLGAERALQLDVGKATSFYERALALTHPGDPDRLPVLLFGCRLVATESLGELGDHTFLEAIE